jgi:hypothetical protein
MTNAEVRKKYPGAEILIVHSPAIRGRFCLELVVKSKRTWECLERQFFPSQAQRDVVSRQWSDEFHVEPVDQADYSCEEEA